MVLFVDSRLKCAGMNSVTENYANNIALVAIGIENNPSLGTMFH